MRNLFAAIVEDVDKRPFITVGFTAFVLMLPLARYVDRRHGSGGSAASDGTAIHRLVYVTGVAAVVHYWWLVKADIRRPLAYGVVVGVLLAFRFYWARIRSAAPQPSRVAAAARTSHSAPRS